jgi:hypothetical protein
MSKRPYHAVLAVETPPDWKPEKVFHLPPYFSNARYYACRVGMTEAIEICRAHNQNRIKEQQSTGATIGTWLLHIRELKTRAYGNVLNMRQTAADPGSRSTLTRLCQNGGGI